MRAPLAIVLAFGLLALSVSCTPTSANQEAVRNAPGMAELFTPSELEDLQRMLNYFENQACALAGSDSSLSYCYRVFADSVAQGTPGTDYIPLDFEAQRQMLGKLNTGTQAALWNHQVVKKGPDGKQVLTLVYQPEGKVMDFLTLLGEEYILVKQYRDHFADIHTITPVMEEEVNGNLSVFNLADVRVRTFLALHYVTLNDAYKRKFNPEVVELPAAPQ